MFHQRLYCSLGCQVNATVVAAQERRRQGISTPRQTEVLVGCGPCYVLRPDGTVERVKRCKDYCDLLRKQGQLMHLSNEEALATIREWWPLDGGCSGGGGGE